MSVLAARLKAVGMIKQDTAAASRLAAVPAAVSLKNCSGLSNPPRKKHIPVTKSKFDRMLPIKEVLTMRTSPLVNAIMETISSTAFLTLG